LKVSFSNAALDDIVRIRIYGEISFGRAIALEYQTKLELAVSQIERYPEADRVREEYATQLRLHFVGAHVIVYSIVPEGIKIVRILGSRQNLRDII
jgi:plasmid stabilization system protein ParE